jgi:hypothetical protein
VPGRGLVSAWMEWQPNQGVLEGVSASAASVGLRRQRSIVLAENFQLVRNPSRYRA